MADIEYSGVYTKSKAVNGQVYDAVMTFFLKKTGGNRDAAAALTSNIIILAQNKSINPIAIIEKFDEYLSKEDFNAALISLLNSDRKTTSKLGFSVTPTIDQYAQRNLFK